MIRISLEEDSEQQQALVVWIWCRWGHSFTCSVFSIVDWDEGDGGQERADTKEIEGSFEEAEELFE